MRSLIPLCRDFGDFIETTGAPVLAIGFILIAGLRGWPWIIGEIVR